LLSESCQPAKKWCPATWHACFLSRNEEPVGTAHLLAARRLAGLQTTGSCSQGILALCPVLSDTPAFVGEISNIFVWFHLSQGFAGQAKFSPTLLVENTALLKSPPSGVLFHRVS